MIWLPGSRVGDSDTHHRFPSIGAVAKVGA